MPPDQVFQWSFGVPFAMSSLSNLPVKVAAMTVLVTVVGTRVTVKFDPTPTPGLAGATSRAYLPGPRIHSISDSPVGAPSAPKTGLLARWLVVWYEASVAAPPLDIRYMRVSAAPDEAVIFTSL